MPRKNKRVHHEDGDALNSTMNSLLNAANNISNSNLISTPIGILPIPPIEKKPHKNDKR